MVPEPERLLATPLPTVISERMNPVTDSENVAVTENAALVGFEDDDESETVGAV